MNLTAFFYDETHDLCTLLEEARFKTRDQDPYGDYEHSPDGKHLLIWKEPGCPWWARKAKRWSLKFRRTYKETFLVASWIFQLTTGDLKYANELAEEFELWVERMCPHCGNDYVVPPSLWDGAAYCTNCGCRAETVAWDQAVKKIRKLLVATLPLEPKDKPLGYKPEPDVWVPVPLNNNDDSYSNNNNDVEINWRNLRDAAIGMKLIYKYTKERNLAKEELEMLWEKAKRRKRKLLAYKELAKKRIIHLVSDAESKARKGLATAERIEEWTSKLPVSENTREFVKERLKRNLELHQIKKNLIFAQE